MTVSELIKELKKHKDNAPVRFTVDLPDSSESECEFVGIYDTELTTYKAGIPHRKRFSVTLALVDKRTESV